jgi:hypothetical protein
MLERLEAVGCVIFREDTVDELSLSAVVTIISGVMDCCCCSCDSLCTVVAVVCRSVKDVLLAFPLGSVMFTVLRQYQHQVKFVRKEMSVQKIKDQRAQGNDGTMMMFNVGSQDIAKAPATMFRVPTKNALCKAWVHLPHLVPVSFNKIKNLPHFSGLC